MFDSFDGGAAFIIDGVIEPSDARAIDRADRPERIYYWMRALGKAGLPGEFALGGVTYRLYHSMKHDFVAATGFYRDDAGRKVVMKMARTQEFAGIPLRWAGHWLRNRETRFYRKLQDLPNIPRFLGYVGQTGFAHEYVEGAPISRQRPPSDGFFEQLEKLLRELHRRGLAYVDTNKPENILLGDDGRPYLIDFQISVDLKTLGDWFFGRWVLRKFQAEDVYHMLKHKRRLRERDLSADERARVERKSKTIKLHRLFTKPYFLFRRRLFKRLRETGRLLPDGSN